MTRILRESPTGLLIQRLQAIDRHLPPGAPLRIALNTRQSVVHQPGTALTIDWSHRFGNAQNREAAAADWQEKLLPALADISRAIQRNVPGRRLVAGGLPSLPAATALGFHFMAPAGVDIAWEQRMPDGRVQIWSREAGREDSGFTADVAAGAVDASDLAVQVSVNSDVSRAVAASAATTGPFRAYVHVKREDSPQSALLQSPGQALDVAEKTVTCHPKRPARIRNHWPGSPVRGHTRRAGYALGPDVEHLGPGPDLRTHPVRRHRMLQTCCAAEWPVNHLKPASAPVHRSQRPGTLEKGNIQTQWQPLSPYRKHPYGNFINHHVNGITKNIAVLSHFRLQGPLKESAGASNVCPSH